VVDGVMKNKNLRMKEKLLELSKKTPIYVLGGNHRLEAYKILQKEQREGGLRTTGLSLFWANCTGGHMNHQRTFER